MHDLNLTAHVRRPDDHDEDRPRSVRPGAPNEVMTDAIMEAVFGCAMQCQCHAGRRACLSSCRTPRRSSSHGCKPRRLRDYRNNFALRVDVVEPLTVVMISHVGTTSTPGRALNRRCTEQIGVFTHGNRSLFRFQREQGSASSIRRSKIRSVNSATKCASLAKLLSQRGCRSIEDVRSKSPRCTRARGSRPA